MSSFPPPPPPPPGRRSVNLPPPPPFTGNTPTQRQDSTSQSQAASNLQAPLPRPPPSAFPAPPPPPVMNGQQATIQGSAVAIHATRSGFPSAPPPPPSPGPRPSAALLAPPAHVPAAHPPPLSMVHQPTMAQQQHGYAPPPPNMGPLGGMQHHPPTAPPFHPPSTPPMPPPGTMHGQSQYQQPHSMPPMSHNMPPPPLPGHHPLGPSPPIPPPHGPPQAMHQQQPLAPRLDPSQMPRPSLCTFPQNDDPNLPLPIYYPRAACLNPAASDPAPPDAHTRFAVLDDGNASPHLMRTTTYCFPRDRSVWHATGDLPLGVVCTPLGVASQDFVARPRTTIDGTMEDWHDPEQIPIVVLNNEASPPRCRHCHAYVNAFYVDGTCNFCGTRNANNNMTQLQQQQPLGTVEYVVGGPYLTREQPVQGMTRVYALDVTCPHVMEYVEILQRLGHDLFEHVSRQNQQSSNQSGTAAANIGVCLVSCVGIAIRSRDGRDFMIVPDVTEDPFAPWPLKEWTFNVSTQQGLEEWNKFCNNQLGRDIKTFKEKTKGKNAQGLDCFEQSCGGAALAFLADALKDTGGRGTLISWRRPNFGVGSIPHRPGKARGRLRPDEDDYPCTPLQVEATYRSPQDEAAALFYKNLATACVKSRVSLDIVMHSDPALHYPYMDLATLGEFCRVTSGKLVWINSHAWQEPIHEELAREIYSFTGWDVVFKLRCSEGIQIKSILCAPGMTVEELVGAPEVELSSLSSTTSLAIELDHRVGGVKKDQPFVYLQAATLYTTWSGQRRVRVSTLAIRTTSQAKEVFRTADFSAISAMLLRRSILNLRRMEGSEDISLRTRSRDTIYIQCIHMLSAYRKETGSMTDQLLLPTRLQTLPLFLMSLLKSTMLRPGVPVRMEGAASAVIIRPSNDERSLLQFHCATACPTHSLLLLFPQIYRVDEAALEGYGDWHSSQSYTEFNGFIRLPPPIHPSLESLEDDGIYLVDGGLKLYLVVGKDVADHVKDQARSLELTDWNPRAYNVLWQLRTYNSIGRGSESELRPTYAPLSVVLQQGNHQNPLELAVMDLMLEDAIGGQRDYSDFLMALQAGIRTHKIS